jgi:hypothetical protein
VKGRARCVALSQVHCQCSALHVTYYV